MPKLCFMIMPFGRKSTATESAEGPTEVDFNRLWDRAYVPVIRDLGYEPVRADQDTGSLIITQMLERLYFADLVLADMTIPNGNVYYEIGIRHAAKETGCVLLAATWSRQLFDIAQMRTVRYPLPEGEITDATADAIRACIAAAIPGLVDGCSPMHGSIKGYPGHVDESAASTMKEHMAELAAFQGRIRAVRAMPRGQRMQLAGELAASLPAAEMTASKAIALLMLLRDCTNSNDDWSHALAFIDRLSERMQSLPEVREQRALAISHCGRHVEAIEQLHVLIETFGPTSERLGLLGGRHKRLSADAASPGVRQEQLNTAIKCYEEGMNLDLNEYYCSSNLARLYRLRKRAGDEERAQSALRLTIAACERAKKRRATDLWLRPTLLAAAFDAADAGKAEELADQIADEDPARWQITSIRDDLDRAIQQVTDEGIRERLALVMGRFDSMLKA